MFIITIKDLVFSNIPIIFLDMSGKELGASINKLKATKFKSLAVAKEALQDLKASMLGITSVALAIEDEAGRIVEQEIL